MISNETESGGRSGGSGAQRYGCKGCVTAKASSLGINLARRY